MAYRSDRDALETRKEAAQRALDEVRGQLAQTQELAEKESALRAEIDEIERRLREPSTHRLPMLDAVSVASPCEAKWSEMHGDDRARFCDHCQKNVFNLSAMERAEAEALIIAKEGKLCVRYFRRADGTVLTADCPVGVRRRKRRRVIAAVVGGSAVVVAAMASMMWFGRTTCRLPLSHAQGQTTMVEGEMSPEPMHTAGTPSVLTPPPPITPTPTQQSLGASENDGRGMELGDVMSSEAPRVPVRTGPAMRPRRR